MSNNNNQPPPWSEAPLWAKYRAQDSDGEWVWYEHEPRIDSSGRNWYAKMQWEVVEKPNPNWRDTLQKRPENE